MPAPNLIERMDEIVQALERAMPEVDTARNPEVLADLEHAYGVAGEVLTMIDGR